jgi:hypothetical protein
MKNRPVLFIVLAAAITTTILTFAVYKRQPAMGVIVCCTLVLASFTAAPPKEPSARPEPKHDRARDPSR